MTAQKDFDLRSWQMPDAGYSQCPFWFWNDALDADEIRRQIQDFRDHGVEAFVIHPRIGLPPSLSWLSDEFFQFIRVALNEARRLGMWVMLYDEGMYPSGSSAGQVVRHNPEFHVRALLCVKASSWKVQDPSVGRQKVLRLRSRHGEEYVVFDRKVEALTRGLHYLGDEQADEPAEEVHPAADLLNPRAVECFRDLVYERFYSECGEFFGNTIRAIFTDEPNPLGRLQTPGAVAGTLDLLEDLNRRAGYDLTPHLLSLWMEDEPDASRHRKAYEEAIAQRLNETYYRPLSRWCENHGIALAGHPAKSDDIGNLRFFQLPGQDIVWREIEPGKPSALAGPASTMAKAASSAAFHLGRDRNLNEFAGAYGESLTFRELQWLASWLLIRGCNLLVPHAFYYSVRGPRRRERPPDVGPHSPWWKGYKAWADATRRLCWLNTVARPVCQVAVLGRATSLPWEAAKVCLENQIDFQYLAPHDLEAASVQGGFLCVGPGRYRVLIVEAGFEQPLPAKVNSLPWEKSQMGELRRMAPPVVHLDTPANDLRCRHLVMENGGSHIFLFFNEGEHTIHRTVTFPVAGEMRELDVWTGASISRPANKPLSLHSHEWRIILIETACV